MSDAKMGSDIEDTIEDTSDEMAKLTANWFTNRGIRPSYLMLWPKTKRLMCY